MGKPGVAGVHANQRLNLSTPWEGLQMICQGFKPDLGNPAVRHSRGASGTVRHGETVNPFRNRKSGNGNPSPTARRARFLSRPWTMAKAKRARKAETPKQPSLCLRLRAPYLYPDPFRNSLMSVYCGAILRRRKKQVNKSNRMNNDSRGEKSSGFMHADGRHSLRPLRFTRSDGPAASQELSH